MIIHAQEKKLGADVMRNLLTKFLIVYVLVFCVSCEKHGAFTDGLPTYPDKTEEFDLSKMDYYGISQIDTFYIDINDNGIKDTIKRGRFFTGTAHGYTFYEVYLDDGQQIGYFRTLESADCFLELYKFNFNPFFVTKISRPLGEEGWWQPTNAIRQVFRLKGNQLEKISEKSVGKICDVQELF